MTLSEAARMVSFGLVVLIWLVQLVIYPSFAEVDPDRFVAHHAAYTRAVSWIVIPLMFAQVLLVGWLVVERPGRWVVIAAAMVGVAWISTFALSVPDHGRLNAGGLDPAVIRHLVATNWTRTIAWTLAWMLLLAAR